LSWLDPRPRAEPLQCPVYCFIVVDCSQDLCGQSRDIGRGPLSSSKATPGDAGVTLSLELVNVQSCPRVGPIVSGPLITSEPILTVILTVRVFQKTATDLIDMLINRVSILRASSGNLTIAQFLEVPFSQCHFAVLGRNRCVLT
jgi:hypothetical protein